MMYNIIQVQFLLFFMSIKKNPSKKRKSKVTASIKKPTSTFKTEAHVDVESYETAIIVSELFRHTVGHSTTFDYTPQLRGYFKNQFLALEKSTFFPIAEENFVQRVHDKKVMFDAGVSLADLPEDLKRVTFIYQLAQDTIEMFSDIEEKRVVEYAVGFTVYDKKVMLRVSKRLLEGGWNCDFYSYGLPLNFVEQYLSDENMDVELISPFEGSKFPSDDYIIKSAERWVKLYAVMLYYFNVKGSKVDIVKRPYKYDGKNYQIRIAQTPIFKDPNINLLPAA